MAQINLMGKPIQTNGDLPKVGETAPTFTLTQNNLKDVSLEKYLSKPDFSHLVLSIVPSLDTGVCAASTKQLEQLATDWPKAQFLVISADLPFAQQRFCAANGVKKIKCLSEMRNKNFAKDYGLLIQDGAMAGLLARAIVIIKDGKIAYTQLVSEITQQPDFEALVAALN